jgi:hypothetical protein
MSEHIFDALTRNTAAVASRRGYARALTGLALGGLWSRLLRLDDVEAKKGKKRRRRNKRKRNKANSPSSPNPSCTSSCAGKVCGDDGCGGSCGGCGNGELCAQGRCVIGQGTCQTGHDICDDPDHTCDIGSDCVCWTSTSNQTRCGQLRPIINVAGFCASDDDCALRFPDVPGAFCVNSTGELCTGAGGACHAPCFAG